MSVVAKKAWIWLKHHWYVPVLIILVILFISPTYGLKNKFFDLLMDTRKRYQQEIDTINKNNAENQEKKNEIVKKHKEALDKIEKDFNVKIDELTKEKQDEVAALVARHKEKPDEMAKEIARLLGANHIKTE
jgi:predicted transcriptional regulator